MLLGEKRRRRRRKVNEFGEIVLCDACQRNHYGDYYDNNTALIVKTINFSDFCVGLATN